jgi:type II secretory ATPase GspE/PulE/Tfp pilus assembly ATPase PilB-like protein
MILKNADSIQTRDVARTQGMKTLLEDGVEKVKKGMTTLREVLRVTQEV